MLLEIVRSLDAEGVAINADGRVGFCASRAFRLREHPAQDFAGALVFFLVTSANLITLTLLVKVTHLVQADLSVVAQICDYPLLHKFLLGAVFNAWLLRAAPGALRLAWTTRRGPEKLRVRVIVQAPLAHIVGLAPWYGCVLEPGLPNA